MQNILFDACEDESLNVTSLESCMYKCESSHFLAQIDGSSPFHILMENENVSEDLIISYLNKAPADAFDIEDDVSKTCTFDASEASKVFCNSFPSGCSLSFHPP